MKYILYITALIIITINIAVAQTVVYLDPPTPTITNQNSVVINVKIAAVNDLKSYNVILLFNENIVEISNINRQGFLRSGGASFSYFGPQPSLQVIIDSVKTSEALTREFSGEFLTASGSGTLFSVEFDIMEAGFTEITIDQVTLRDTNENNIPVDFSSGSIKVLLPVQAKVFFEGPFETISMNTNLNSGGLLPITQPYNKAPWNYNGTENVAANFFNSNPNIVDWVLLEVRSGLSESTKLDEKACFVLDDGNIVGLDGVNPVYFDLNSDEYYLVIKHRNHLSIINALPYLFSRENSAYDFTDSLNKAYGSGAMAELAAGVFGMYSGDANADGNITGTDFNIFNPLFRSAAAGYLNSDFNLDGSITGTDFNLFNPNFRNARTSQVP